jgi:hypothetical protein
MSFRGPSCNGFISLFLVLFYLLLLLMVFAFGADTSTVGAAVKVVAAFVVVFSFLVLLRMRMLLVSATLVVDAAAVVAVIAFVAAIATFTTIFLDDATAIGDVIFAGRDVLLRVMCASAANLCHTSLVRSHRRSFCNGFRRMSPVALAIAIAAFCRSS